MVNRMVGFLSERDLGNEVHVPDKFAKSSCSSKFLVENDSGTKGCQLLQRSIPKLSAGAKDECGTPHSLLMVPLKSQD